MSKELIKNLNLIKANMVPCIATIQQAAVRMQPAIQAYAVEMEKVRRKFAPIALEMQEKAVEFATQVIKWQKEKKIHVSLMAKNGWFPNWHTFFCHPEEGNDSLDDFMISHIDECWDKIKKKMVELCPNREHIFNVIFELHEQKNYVASIPLIFTQADGICGEEFTYFFSADPNTKKKASDDILEKYDNGEIKLNIFTEFLLEPFKTKLQLSNGSSKHTKPFKLKGPNRHGIIHGSRRHLDYGSKINGYKTLSFLAFLIYTTKDKFKKT